jgi:hypothetical protein
MTHPLQSALAVSAGYPAPAPVPAVEYHSQGRLLIIGEAARAAGVATSLAADLPVTVLSNDGH